MNNVWIVDDDGDMFNTDHYRSIHYSRGNNIVLVCGDNAPKDWHEFKLSKDLTAEERLTRYYDLVEKLSGERIDE